MENLAIIIGISEYEKQNNLTACYNDSRLIYEIIKSSNKYSEILYITGKATNREVFDKIENLKKNFDGKNIGEIFLYFSGHGYTKNDEFYYITSNTDTKNINSTSLVNSQVDSVFRDLNPNLFVKIVDACHSGVPYIKGDETILMKDIKQYKKCFFMFSSMQEQVSIASDTISYFTKSYIEAIKRNLNQKSIRYSEIANYIADYFQNNNKQTPIFVTQTDMLDEFIEYSDEVKKILGINGNIDNDLIDTSEKVQDEEVKLENILEEKLSKSATKEDAKRFLDNLTESIQKYQIKDAIIDKYFSIDIEIFNEIGQVSNKSYISNWIYENRKKLNLFAKSDIGTSNVLSSVVFSLQEFYGVKKEAGFKVTESELPCQIKIFLNSKNLGLEKYELSFVLIYSYSSLYIFSSFIKNSPITWGEYEYENMEPWKLTSFNIKVEIDNINIYINETLDEFILKCTESLEKYLQD